MTQTTTTQQLATLLDGLADVPPTAPRRRKAQVYLILRTGVALAHERDALMERLDQQWDWLARHDDHPELEARTDHWIASLRRYEAMCDLLTRAEGML